MKTIIIILIILAAISHGYRLLEKRRHNKIVKSKIAFDRIARLSDVGEKDISYSIRSVERVLTFGASYQGPSEIIRVQFFYNNPKITDGNQSTYVGEIQQIYSTHNNFSGLEEIIADRIKSIKATPYTPRSDPKKSI